jgi:hypothetical protein
VYSANNAGERSIRAALFERPDVFDTVVTYDDDMGPSSSLSGKQASTFRSCLQMNLCSSCTENDD